MDRHDVSSCSSDPESKTKAHPGPYTLGLIRLSSVTDILRDPVTGKKPSPKSVYRWAVQGISGVVLRTIRTPYGRCTTLDHLQVFLKKLSGLREEPTSASPETDNENSASASHLAALKILNGERHGHGNRESARSGGRR